MGGLGGGGAVSKKTQHKVVQGISCIYKVITSSWWVVQTKENSNPQRMHLLFLKTTLHTNASFFLIA